MQIHFNNKRSIWLMKNVHPYSVRSPWNYRPSCDAIKVSAKFSSIYNYLYSMWISNTSNGISANIA